MQKVKDLTCKDLVIQNMSAPTNITELQVFLSLVNYYQVYIINIHDFCASLNELMKKREKKLELNLKMSGIFSKNKRCTDVRTIPYTF